MGCCKSKIHAENYLTYSSLPTVDFLSHVTMTRFSHRASRQKQLLWATGKAVGNEVQPLIIKKWTWREGGTSILYIHQNEYTPKWKYIYIITLNNHTNHALLCSACDLIAFAAGDTERYTPGTWGNGNDNQVIQKLIQPAMWNDAMERHYLSCAFPTILDAKQLNMTLSLFHQIWHTGKHIQYTWVPPQTDVAPTIHVVYLFHYKLQICREPFPGLLPAVQHPNTMWTSTATSVHDDQTRIQNSLSPHML